MKLSYSIVVHNILLVFFFIAIGCLCPTHGGYYRDAASDGHKDDTTTSSTVPTTETDETPSPPSKISYNGTKEIVSFINFSDKLVQLYWVDTDGPIDPTTGKVTEYYAAVARPYEVTTTQTFSGHVFSYRWGQARFTHTVDETSNIFVDDETTTKVDDTEEGIKAQIHILGDMKIDTNENEIEYKELVLNGKIKRKPETIVVECTTNTYDEFQIKVKPFWSPLGAARFLELMSKNVQYYEGCVFNRVISKFLTQFGISKNYDLRTKYRSLTIEDDDSISPPISFQPGYMSYAGSGPNSRTTEVFIVMPNTSQNQLNAFGTNPWETPFGYIEEQYLNDVVSKFYNGYGDFINGNGPQPNKIYDKDGYDIYLKEQFPELSYIRSCIILDSNDDEYNLNDKGLYSELSEDEL
jgi:peptidyl-prolyl cis-trans isomerase A (cyclophilin A)